MDDVAVDDVLLPALVLDTTDLYVQLEYGETAGADSFQVGNDGAADLEYAVEYSPAMGRITNYREIDGAHFYSADPPPQPGETVDIDIYVVNDSQDAEWLDSLVMTWPTGVTINSSTDFVVVGGTRYLEWGGETGDAAVTPGLTMTADLETSTVRKPPWPRLI